MPQNYFQSNLAIKAAKGTGQTVNSILNIPESEKNNDPSTDQVNIRI